MAATSKITVRAPARLHFGLFDCGNTTFRLFGGLGAAINGLDTTLHAERSNEWKLIFPESLPPSKRLANDAEALILRLKKINLSACQITIESTTPEHMGLGSKTSLFLAVVHASNHLNGALLSRTDVTRLTGRGGTSGIGVNLFWDGGIITDSGHQSKVGQRNFQPSSARKEFDLPQVLVRIEPSPQLRVRLFNDAFACSIDGAREQEAFRSLMPIADLENLRAIAAAYHGVVPAFQNNDMFLLADSLRELNKVGLKAAEVEMQSDNTKQWLKQCWENSVPAGLSSFGPTVYSIGHKGSAALAHSSQVAKDFNLHEIGEFSFDQKGAITS